MAGHTVLFRTGLCLQQSSWILFPREPHSQTCSFHNPSIGVNGTSIQPGAPANSLEVIFEPLFLSHLTSNPSVNPVACYFETDLEYAHSSCPGCHPAISHLGDCRSLLLSLPLLSAPASSPLQPLLQVQREGPNWTKVRQRPSSARHPAVAPTKVFTMAHRALYDLAPSTLGCISSLPAPWMQAPGPPCSCSEDALPLASALAGAVPGTLFSQIPKILSPSPPSGLCTNVTAPCPHYQSGASQATAGPR